MPTIDKFPDYLLSSLPEGYPISTIPLSMTMTEAHRKELVFQQGKFLDAADQLTQEQPWIAFIAALKHLRLLESYETYTTNFRDLADKEYFDRIQLTCSQILNTASSNLDDDTKSNCEKLVHIQILHRDISNAADAVRNAIANGIRSFEPPMTAPEQKMGCGGCLVVIACGLLVGAIATSYSEEHGGFIGGVAVIIGGLVWAQVMKPQFDKEKSDKAIYKTFTSLRDTYYFHAGKLDTRLSFGSTAMASDLTTCLARLNDFLADLDVLKDTYIKPYV